MQLSDQTMHLCHSQPMFSSRVASDYSVWAYGKTFGTLGRSIKVQHKAGMRHLIETKLQEKLLLLGEHNDTFVRVNTPFAAAMHWVRSFTFAGLCQFKI